MFTEPALLHFYSPEMTGAKCLYHEIDLRVSRAFHTGGGKFSAQCFGLFSRVPLNLHIAMSGLADFLYYHSMDYTFPALVFVPIWERI